MNESESSTQVVDARNRRRFLGGIIAAIQAAIGGTLGVVMGVISMLYAYVFNDYVPALPPK